jgi:transposase
MSKRELSRVEVLARVKSGQLRVVDASELMRVSYRQGKRLWKRYREEGAAGLKHRSAGRRSNRAYGEAFRKKVLGLVREKYGGAVGERFGPTLAAEHLRSEDGEEVNAETLRRWMLAAGLWSRERRRKRHRRRRERKEHFGELVQMDGSFHAWLEGRGPGGCLMDLVDDATNRTLARLGEEETIWAAAGALRRWIERYGVPQALYVDWKNLYKRPATAQERLRGEEPVTQFGRMCQKLRIEVIAASSPQAKGRVERIHGTHQDRLVKKLRRKGITTQAEANRYLEAEYLEEHNERFGRLPRRREDYHRRAPRASELDKIFRLEGERTISEDWVVRYENRYFQLEPESRNYAPARGKVVVWERPDGEIGIEYRGRAVRWREIEAPARPITQEKKTTAVPKAGKKKWVPAADHPWRKAALRRSRALPSASP